MLEVLFCREIKLLELNIIYLVLVSMNPDFIFSYANSFSVEAFTFVKLFSTLHIIRRISLLNKTHRGTDCTKSGE